MHEYIRWWMSGVFNDQKFTILNEWSQQRSQHSDSLRNGVIITQNCIILTELKDYMHEYIRWWMSGVFNDHKFTILN